VEGGDCDLISGTILEFTTTDGRKPSARIAGDPTEIRTGSRIQVSENIVLKRYPSGETK
jgi:hypothetical protein